MKMNFVGTAAAAMYFVFLLFLITFQVGTIHEASLAMAGLGIGWPGPGETGVGATLWPPPRWAEK